MAKAQVIARFAAREGSENQLAALLQSMLAPTRAELGCEMYELYESDSRGRCYLCEAWASEAALDQHMATPHFKRLKQAGGEFVREPFEINFVKRILAGAAAA
ncbi:MAG: putative quinol monooxygenase [Candidatus Sulfotelmatobacter sp.]|jgi:quinol monooxygenase YgiN